SFLRLRIALIKVGRTQGGKTELELLQTLRRYDVDLVDVWNGIGQTRVHDVVVRAKPRPHPNRVCGDGHEPKQQREERGCDPDAGDHTENQLQRFNWKMFGNGRSRHKSALIDSKLSRQRKPESSGDRTCSTLCLRTERKSSRCAPSPGRRVDRCPEFLDSPLAHSKTEA